MRRQLSIPYVAWIHKASKLWGSPFLGLSCRYLFGWKIRSVNTLIDVVRMNEGHLSARLQYDWEIELVRLHNRWITLWTHENCRAEKYIHSDSSTITWRYSSIRLSTDGWIHITVWGEINWKTASGIARYVKIARPWVSSEISWKGKLVHQNQLIATYWGWLRARFWEVCCLSR